MKTEFGSLLCGNVTDAVMALLDELGPHLGQTAAFETLGDVSGLALFMRGGGSASDREDITGARLRLYKQPFELVFRTAFTGEAGRKYAFDLLETVGGWLSGERITVGGEDVRIGEYPMIRDGRIVRITRAASYPAEPAKNGVYERILPITAEYECLTH